MKIETKEFLVREGKRLDLKKRPTRCVICESKDQYKEVLAKHVKQLEDLHQLLYSMNEYALLVVFQGMDAGGKDGAIRHVMSGVNPQGCEVTSFKQPSAEELEHDFLWRAEAKLPGRGRIGIFNRSHYEEVLVTRVHPELIAHEGLSARAARGKEFWKERYHSIVELEKHLYRNNTRIVKVFLHLSKEEQKQRLLARIDDPAKNWKFSEADIHERKYWSEYQRAFEECLESTSTAHAPWYVVPADDKESARLIVSQIVVDALKAMKMSYPGATQERKKELAAIRARLERQ